MILSDTWHLILCLKTDIENIPKEQKNFRLFAEKWKGIRCDSERQLLTLSFVLPFLERGAAGKFGQQEMCWKWGEIATNSPPYFAIT